MTFGRIPGPLGRFVSYGCVYRSGPLDGESDDDFAHFTPGAMGSGADLAQRLATKADDAEDEEELKLLVAVYGALKDRAGHSSYTSMKAKKRQYATARYVIDRDAFFGSREAYKTYLAASRAELDADKAVLRKYIEPGQAARQATTTWARAQDVFYAWVRKAFENKLGAGTDVPKLIKAQMSEELKNALAQVRHDYGKEFKAGGFNPRPQKLNGYLLGTVSEHGIGKAIDIDDTRNPHIEVAIWKALQAYAGKTVDHSKGAWDKTPKSVYDDIKAVNDTFVSKLKKALADAEAARAKATAAAVAAKKPPPDSKATPLSLAMAADPQLSAIGARFATDFGNGFISLPWDLVKALHDHGFLWGATFSHPDIMHFEL